MKVRLLLMKTITAGRADEVIDHLYATVDVDLPDNCPLVEHYPTRYYHPEVIGAEWFQPEAVSDAARGLA